MNLRDYLLLLFCSIILSSCGSTKKIAYLQDAENFQDTLSHELYDARIKPKDLLTITVSTFDRDVALPFNLVMPRTTTNSELSVNSTPTLQSYLVDNDGLIDFPVLGRIKVGGMTKREVETMLKEKLSSYIKEEPLVNVRMVNYKITVLGEVAKPSTFTVANEKINIYEALAMAGDMTIYGRRENVKLVRELENGGKSIVVLDLTDKNLISSPYFYLQQNDVIYVEPNKAKAKNSGYSTTTSLWLTATSIMISLTSLIVTIYRLK
ncbi:MAG: polysaccharide biosynthesis/export family protein [Paludibacteraceae bacterium]|nr:polysaccharide biosynthesis/export family protein [Paludibacteraceae bacterium]